MKKLIVALSVILLLTSCSERTKLPEDTGNPSPEPTMQSSVGMELEENREQELTECSLVYSEGMTVGERFRLPSGFERVPAEKDSFADYLRNLPLKADGTKVLYFDGREKPRDVHAAVIDMDVGDRDLQQCADAVMRLRAEYLYGQERYEDIHFNFTNGFNAEYAKWIQGYRIKVKGNNVSWEKQGNGTKEYADFRKYLDMVFSYAGTLSLSKELKPVLVEDMAIGDVFIRGGSPGHCVIVVDMAENKATGEKLFMVAQSYMPAQSIHILKNEQNADISPWYSVDFAEELHTPEWTFQRGELMRFEE